MKRYYIQYWDDFSNFYNLYWAETPEQIAIAEAADARCERITRCEAERKCAEENYRRKHDAPGAYYADHEIFPVDYNRSRAIVTDRRMHLQGYLWLYR